ncbi:Uncharacterized protein, contains PIN domain [Ruaniaceae bacterium KH17]|nr:Uncharacterized protein, contains PIN domain [Ruaniaceae bacterium KH17]
MILDTSAIVAILNLEEDAVLYAQAIEQAPQVSISSATVLEATLVLGRSRIGTLREFLAEASASVIPVDEEHLAVAQEGWLRFGRGSGSQARLNYGDCFPYAAACIAGEPLLFKGNDFTHTDLASALS